MSSIRVIQGDFEKKLKLQFAPGIKAVISSKLPTGVGTRYKVPMSFILSEGQRYE